jgi:hypothetical protein
MGACSPRVVGLIVGLVAAASLVLGGVAEAKPSPGLTIAPRSALVGEPVLVSGHGFRPRLEGVVVFGVQRVASFRASAKGVFRVRFVVPTGPSRRLRVIGEQTLRGRHGSTRRLRLAAVGFRVVAPSGVGNAIVGAPLLSPISPTGPVSGPTGGGGTGGGSGIPESPKAPESPPAPESPKAPASPPAPESPTGQEAPKGSGGGGKGTKSTKGPKGTEPPKGTGGPESTEGSKSTEGTGGTEAPKGTEPPQGTEAPKGTEGAGGSWWIPPQHLTWYWQLQGTVDNNEPVEAYDIDGFENTAAEVAALHAQGKHVICYVDVGTYEPGRPDSSDFPASVLGSGVQGWPGERWLDISNLGVLEPIMTARFQMCREKGFDAVEPDNMDGYENGSGFPLTAQQQLAYDEWVASEVHSLGMAVLQKNDGEQTAQLEPHFDGALDEQCNQYSECANFQAYLTAGKPVLNAEYELSTSAFCAADDAVGIMGARYDLELDGKTFEPCW